MNIYILLKQSSEKIKWNEWKQILLSDEKSHNGLQCVYDVCVFSFEPVMILR